MAIKALRAGEHLSYGPVHDDNFAALNSREEVDAYLALHKVGPNGRLLAHTVWNSYLIARNLRIARLTAASTLAASNSQT
jgi:hypothetical protein